MEELANNTDGVISLSQGVPGYFSNDLIRLDVIKAIEENKVDRYSDVAGIPEFREKISEHLHDNGMDYDMNEIVVTAGAMQGLSASFMSLVSPGDEVIVLSPAYSYYEKMVNSIGGKTRFVEFIKGKDRWELDINEVKKAINKKTKLIILCNPNNPTGNILSKEEIIALGDLAIKKNLILISDDVYQNLYFTEEKPFNICELSKYKEHVIRIVSFSKDFNLTGWRIGFLHSHRKIIKKIIGTHDLLINCAPVVSQYAGLSALKHFDKLIKDSLIKYSQHRDMMGSELENMRDHIDFSWPEGTYYFFVKVNNIENSEDFCIDLYNKAKLTVVPGSAFGAGGEGHVRLCFGRSKGNIKEGLNRLSNYFTHSYHINS